VSAPIEGAQAGAPLQKLLKVPLGTQDLKLFQNLISKIKVILSAAQNLVISVA